MSRQQELDEDLPDELREAFGQEQEATADQVAALTSILVDKKNKAVAARKNSGIEDTWMICEEAYVGIDDMNRGEFANAKWAKPTSMAGPVTTDYTKADKTRSSAYVRITSRYVDMATAKVSEILLPIDDKSFSISPTPIPELVRSAGDKTPTRGPDGQSLYRDQTADEIAEAGMKAEAQMRAQASQGNAMPSSGAFDPTQPVPAPTPAPAAAQPGAAPAPSPAPTTPQVPMTVADFAKMKLEAAEDAADKAETRIWDQLVECNYANEARKMLFDGARIGVGILKGPVPEISRVQAVTQTADGFTLEIREEIVPVVKWVDPWNFYPSDECGEDVHDGEGIFEQDFLSAKTLKKLAKQKGYRADIIEQIIEEGPKVSGESSQNPNEKKGKNSFQVFYYTGSLTRDEMAILNGEALADLPPDQDMIYVIVTMVNDQVVRATLNPLDSGRFPYNVFPWSRRPGSWTGVGVAEQVATPQRITNAATRALLNNAGVSAGAQVIVDRMSIVPADGNWTLTPNKIWYNVAGQPIADVREVFALVEFPNVGAQLMDVINYGFKLAEEQSNISLVAQGQMSDKMPDTFGAAQLLNTNSNSLLRAIGYGYDSHVTHHMINAFYEWLMLDPNVPNDEKGDFKINAHGSAALVERAIQEQVYSEILEYSKDPAYRVSPALAMEQWLKSRRIDARRVQYSEQEQAKMDATPAQPPVQIQVAQINAQAKQATTQAQAQSAAALQQQESQARLQELAAEDQREQQQLTSGQATPHMAQAQARVQVAQIQATSQASIEASRAQSEQAYAATEAQIARDNAQAKLEELQLTREIAMLNYANQQKISLDTLKAQLAKTSMIEQTKRQLAMADQQATATEANLDRGHDMAKHVSNLAADAQAAAPPGAPADENAGDDAQ